MVSSHLLLFFVFLLLIERIISPNWGIFVIVCNQLLIKPNITNIIADDDESGDDDNTAPTRDYLKKKSQQIIDSKMKKGRNRPRKKKAGKL